MDKERLFVKNGYLVTNVDRTIIENETSPLATNHNVVVIVERGEITINFHSEQYVIGAKQLLCLPSLLYVKDVSLSEDFEGRVIVTNHVFLLDALVGIPTSYFDNIYSHGVITISDPLRWELLTNFVNNLAILQDGDFIGVKQGEVSAGIYRSLAILIANSMSTSPSTHYFSQSDIYFRRFVELIETNVHRYHEVAFYAEQLNITSKYLSEICKQKCDHKAKEMISSFLIARLKHEMLTTGKSIKVLAYEYNFADQSSMGKFFNKMTGMSPNQFKRNQSRE